MAKSSRQKAKLLYLQKILFELTDENHGITINEMINELEKYGIKSERKSLYNDLKILENFGGMDICKTKSNTVKYYLASRDFEVPELKMLVDAIQSARFISSKKSLALIKKLEGLVSKYDGSQLQEHVHIVNRVKTYNEKIYYNIDTVTNAIEADRQITFKYFRWKIDCANGCTVKKEERHAGKLYKVSPWALNWSDENYYLIAFDSESNMVKHYRIDKMEHIEISDDLRDGKSQYEQFDISNYNKYIFSMFGGEVADVKLSVDDEYIGVLADKFGENIFIVKNGEHTFCVTVRVMLSPKFYAWIFSMGDKIEILSPENAVNEYKNTVKQVLKLYE